MDKDRILRIPCTEISAVRVDKDRILRIPCTEISAVRVDTAWQLSPESKRTVYSDVFTLSYNGAHLRRTIGARLELATPGLEDLCSLH